MDFRQGLKEKLSKLIFLELKKDFAARAFKADGLMDIEGEVYVPLSPDYIAKNLERDMIKNLPVGEFVKGMYYCLGADRGFRNTEAYRLMLENIGMESLVKGLVARLIKDGRKDEAIIYLLGLYEVHGEKDVTLNTLALLEELSIEDRSYLDGFLALAEEVSQKGLLEAKLFLGSALRMKGDFPKALVVLRDYIIAGGEETPELSSELERIGRKALLEESEAVLYEDPGRFLEMILPILTSESDNPKLLLQVAIAYRNLKNHDKAIFYLNEALALDDGYADVFDRTMTIEVLTNLIMCYVNLGDMESAMKHIAIGEKISPDDDVLTDIKKFLKR
jgi:tetratricopeptide (TPR) repeat protein